MMTGGTTKATISPELREKVLSFRQEVESITRSQYTTFEPVEALQQVVSVIGLLKHLG